MATHSTDDAEANSAAPLDEPNLLPGPTDRGGHGGMATREQEAREWLEQHPGEQLQAAPKSFNEQNAGPPED